MQSCGDLLIGGMTLKQLSCELKQEELDRGSRDWLLAGHLQVTQEQAQQLELNRQYRLQLKDGRGGPVLVTRVATNHGGLLVDFQPRPGQPR